MPELVPSSAACHSTSAIVVRSHNSVDIQQRRADGYINATAMCRANNKQWADYWRLKGTQEFLAAFSANMGIPILDLVQSRVGGDHAGTWVHPELAIDLAQWLSPLFRVRVSSWVHELLTTGKVELASPKQPAAPLPWSARLDPKLVTFRHALDRQHPDRWSVLTVAVVEILALEDVLVRAGFPLRMSDLPDLSIGRRWSDYRRGKPWAIDAIQDTELATGNIVLGRPHFCKPFLYRNDELVHFNRWLGEEYARKGFGEYLDRKFKQEVERPQIAAVANQVSLARTGMPALLPRPCERAARLHHKRATGPQQAQLAFC